MAKPRTEKADVLAAARRVFEHHGYAGATTERIAEEAGVSRVTLHRRGMTRDSLLRDLVAGSTEHYRRAMWPVLTSDGSGAKRLRRALEALCESAEEHLALLVALRAQSDAVFHRDDQEEAMTRTVFTEPFERLFRDGAADGSLREVDAIETATVVFNMVGLTYIHLRTDHGWKPAKARRATIEPVVRGFLA